MSNQDQSFFSDFPFPASNQAYLLKVGYRLVQPNDEEKTVIMLTDSITPRPAENQFQFDTKKEMDGFLEKVSQTELHIVQKRKGEGIKPLYTMCLYRLLKGGFRFFRESPDYGPNGQTETVTIKMQEWNETGGSGGYPTASGWKIGKLSRGKHDLSLGRIPAANVSNAWAAVLSNPENLKLLY